jgi:hypothetical protein
VFILVVPEIYVIEVIPVIVPVNEYVPTPASTTIGLVSVPVPACVNDLSVICDVPEITLVERVPDIVKLPAIDVVLFKTQEVKVVVPEKVQLSTNVKVTAEEHVKFLVKVNPLLVRDEVAFTIQVPAPAKVIPVPRVTLPEIVKVMPVLMVTVPV